MTWDLTDGLFPIRDMDKKQIRSIDWLKQKKSLWTENAQQKLYNNCESVNGKQ